MDISPKLYTDGELKQMKKQIQTFEVHFIILRQTFQKVDNICISGRFSSSGKLGI